MPEMKEVLDQVQHIINKHGVAIISVMEDEGEPGFSYTAGLGKLGLPNIIVFGLPALAAKQILNSAVEKLRNGQVEDHSIVEGLANFPMAFREAKPALDYMGVANHIEGDLFGTKMPLQMIWPDRYSKFPWDLEFDEESRKIQPLLFDVSSH